jgi:hypothetical protein
MNYAEANNSHARQNPADLCIILRNIAEGELPMGLLFIDASKANAFGSDSPLPGTTLTEKVARDLEERAEVKSLAAALSRAMMQLRLGTPQIKIDP